MHGVFLLETFQMDALYIPLDPHVPSVRTMEIINVTSGSDYKFSKLNSDNYN